MLPTSFHFEFRHSLFDIRYSHCPVLGFRFFVGTRIPRIYRFIFCPNNLRLFASDSWLSGCPIHVSLVFLVFLLLGLASVDVFCQFHQCAAMAADHWPIPPFFGGDFGSQIQYKT